MSDRDDDDDSGDQEDREDPASGGSGGSWNYSLSPFSSPRQVGSEEDDDEDEPSPATSAVSLEPLAAAAAVGADGSTRLWRRGPAEEGEDLTGRGSKCFAKALLDCLNPDGHGFGTYYSYLDSFLMTEPDSRFSALWGRPGIQEKVARQFYRLLKPSQEPLLFSFFSSPCLTRAARLADVELVIFKSLLTTTTAAAPGAGRINPTRRREPLVPYQDLRGLRGSGEDSRQSRLGLCFKTGKAQTERRYLRVVGDLSELDDRFNRQGSAPGFCFSRENAVSLWKDRGVCQSTEDCLEALDKESFVLSDPLEDLPRLDRPGQLLEDPERVERALWKRWGRRVLLVTFTHHSLALAERNKSLGGSSGGREVAVGFPRPKQCKFVVLCFVRPPSDPDETPNRPVAADSVDQLGPLSGVPVVAFWGSGLTCLLAESYAESVRQSFFRTEGTGERVPNSRLRSFVPPSKARVEGRRRQLAANKSEKSKRLNQLKKWCRCQTCEGSAEYDLNMSRAGPEKLVTTDFTLPQLLKMLGLWEGEATARLLDRACELSVAAMDIESRTVELTLEPPGPGPNVRYGEIDTAALESHPRFIQVPVMLAHLDGATVSRDPSALFTAKDDSEKGVRDLMKSYLGRLLEGQLRCSREKFALLSPLLERVSAYKEAYKSYCADWKARSLRDLQRQESELREQTFGPPAANYGGPSGSKRTRTESPAAARSSEERAAWNWDQFLTGRPPASSGSLNAGAGRLESADRSESETESDLSDSQARAESELGDSASTESSVEDNASLGPEDSSSSAPAASAPSTGQLLFQAGLDALVLSRPSCLVGVEHRHRFLGSSPRGKEERKKKFREFEDLTARAWPHTLPGQLERKLRRLATDYSVFSFYG